MSAIRTLAWNDVRQTARDRAAFFWMLVLPVLLMWLFGQAGGSGAAAKVSLAVVDLDGGWLAREFVDALRGDRVSLSVLTPEAATVAEKPPPRTLVIPEGFTAGALAGEKQTLRLEKRAGADEEFSLAAEVVVARAITRTLGRLVELDGADGKPLQGDDAGAEAAFRALDARAALVTLDVSTSGSGRPVPRGFAQSVPGMLTMFVLMMTLIYGGVFLTLEKRSGMLRRQASLPLSPRTLFLGKLAGRMALCSLQIAILLVAGAVLFGASYGSSPAALALLLLCYAFAVASLATLLGAALSTPEQASTVGWLLSMVLAAMGGCWWPSEVVPRWLWHAAHVLPTAWAMDGFHALISFGRGLEGVWLPSLALAGFGLVFTVLGSRLLRV